MQVVDRSPFANRIFVQCAFLFLVGEKLIDFRFTHPKLHAGIHEKKQTSKNKKQDGERPRFFP